MEKDEYSMREDYEQFLRDRRDNLPPSQHDYGGVLALDDEAVKDWQKYYLAGFGIILGGLAIAPFLMLRDMLVKGFERIVVSVPFIRHGCGVDEKLFEALVKQKKWKDSVKWLSKELRHDSNPFYKANPHSDQAFKKVKKLIDQPDPEDIEPKLLSIPDRFKNLRERDFLILDLYLNQGKSQLDIAEQISLDYDGVDYNENSVKEIINKQIYPKLLVNDKIQALNICREFGLFQYWQSYLHYYGLTGDGDLFIKKRSSVDPQRLPRTGEIIKPPSDKLVLPKGGEITGSDKIKEYLKKKIFTDKLNGNIKPVRNQAITDLEATKDYAIALNSGEVLLGEWAYWEFLDEEWVYKQENPEYDSKWLVKGIYVPPP